MVTCCGQPESAISMVKSVSIRGLLARAGDPFKFSVRTFRIPCPRNRILVVVRYWLLANLGDLNRCLAQFKNGIRDPRMLGIANDFVYFSGSATAEVASPSGQRKPCPGACHRRLHSRVRMGHGNVSHLHRCCLLDHSKGHPQTKRGRSILLHICGHFFIFVCAHNHMCVDGGRHYISE